MTSPYPVPSSRRLAVLAAVLLAPARALRRPRATRVTSTCRTAMTLAQQFGYQPDYRQHVDHVRRRQRARASAAAARARTTPRSCNASRAAPGCGTTCSRRCAPPIPTSPAPCTPAATAPTGSTGTSTAAPTPCSPSASTTTAASATCSWRPADGLPVLAGPRAPVRRRHAADRPARLGQRHERSTTAARSSLEGPPLDRRRGSSSGPGRASGPRSTSSRSSSRTGAAARSLLRGAGDT